MARRILANKAKVKMPAQDRWRVLPAQTSRQQGHGGCCAMRCRSSQRCSGWAPRSARPRTQPWPYRRPQTPLVWRPAAATGPPRGCCPNLHPSHPTHQASFPFYVHLCDEAEMQACHCYDARSRDGQTNAHVQETPLLWPEIAQYYTLQMPLGGLNQLKNPWGTPWTIP